MYFNTASIHTFNTGGYTFVVRYSNYLLLDRSNYRELCERF